MNPFQYAMIMDELPDTIKNQIVKVQDNEALIFDALKDVDLSGYYSNVKDLKFQRKHTARQLYLFFDYRKNRKLVTNS